MGGFLMNLERILLIGGTGALGQQVIERHYINKDIIVFSRDGHKHENLTKRVPD